MLLSEKVVLLQKKCDECWLMGYRVRYLAYPLHPTQWVLDGQQVHASWELVFLSYYEPFQVHVGNVVSDPDIYADVPSVQLEYFHREYQ
jgi:hypothetical protein